MFFIRNTTTQRAKKKQKTDFFASLDIKKVFMVVRLP